MTTSETDELSQVDWDALTLAIEVTKRESPARRRQIDIFLSSRPWLNVAKFCAGCAQGRVLNLPPWQPPPCYVGNMEAALADTDEVTGYRAAALLRKRMPRCGVSRWHPNPVAACEANEAEQRQTAK